MHISKYIDQYRPKKNPVEILVTENSDSHVDVSSFVKLVLLVGLLIAGTTMSVHFQWVLNFITSTKNAMYFTFNYTAFYKQLML